MKKILFIVTLLFVFVVSAQDSTEVKAQTPKIISKLMFGKTIAVDNLEFKFVTLESDSRCPKGVQCVRAGEAIVLIDVFKNGTKIEQKRLIFSPNAQLQNSLGNLFSSKKIKVTGFNIAPYPEYRNKIKPKDYFIQLDIRE
ncbi:MAG: hypothetical protein QNK89_02520 [Lacinutrix sp.]|uniref:hypothetical protein n=1 Tax=Lacinutrix sp. TaxID=1937692 RepID=UPI0030AB197F